MKLVVTSAKVKPAGAKRELKFTVVVYFSTFTPPTKLLQQTDFLRVPYQLFLSKYGGGVTKVHNHSNEKILCLVFLSCKSMIFWDFWSLQKSHSCFLKVCKKIKYIHVLWAFLSFQNIASMFFELLSLQKIQFMFFKLV